MGFGEPISLETEEEAGSFTLVEPEVEEIGPATFGHVLDPREISKVFEHPNRVKLEDLPTAGQFVQNLGDEIGGNYMKVNQFVIGSIIEGGSALGRAFSSIGEGVLQLTLGNASEQSRHIDHAYVQNFYDPSSAKPSLGISPYGERVLLNSNDPKTAAFTAASFKTNDPDEQLILADYYEALLTGAEVPPTLAEEIRTQGRSQREAIDGITKEAQDFIGVKAEEGSFGEAAQKFTGELIAVAAMLKKLSGFEGAPSNLLKKVGISVPGPTWIKALSSRLLEQIGIFMELEAGLGLIQEGPEEALQRGTTTAVHFPTNVVSGSLKVMSGRWDEITADEAIDTGFMTVFGFIPAARGQIGNKIRDHIRMDGILQYRAYLAGLRPEIRPDVIKEIERSLSKNPEALAEFRELVSKPILRDLKVEGKVVAEEVKVTDPTVLKTGEEARKIVEGVSLPSPLPSESQAVQDFNQFMKEAQESAKAQQNRELPKALTPEESIAELGLIQDWTSSARGHYRNGANTKEGFKVAVQGTHPGIKVQEINAYWRALKDSYETAASQMRASARHLSQASGAPMGISKSGRVLFNSRISASEYAVAAAKDTSLVPRQVKTEGLIPKVYETSSNTFSVRWVRGSQADRDLFNALKAGDNLAHVPPPRQPSNLDSVPELAKLETVQPHLELAPLTKPEGELVGEPAAQKIWETLDTFEVPADVRAHVIDRWRDVRMFAKTAGEEGRQAPSIPFQHSKQGEGGLVRIGGRNHLTESKTTLREGGPIQGEGVVSSTESSWEGATMHSYPMGQGLTPNMINVSTRGQSKGGPYQFSAKYELNKTVGSMDSPVPNLLEVERLMNNPRRLKGLLDQGYEGIIYTESFGTTPQLILFDGSKVMKGQQAVRTGVPEGSKIIAQTDDVMMVLEPATQEQLSNEIKKTFDAAKLEGDAGNEMKNFFKNEAGAKLEFKNFFFRALEVIKDIPGGKEIAVKAEAAEVRAAAKAGKSGNDVRRIASELKRMFPKETKSQKVKRILRGEKAEWVKAVEEISENVLFPGTKPFRKELVPIREKLRPHFDSFLKQHQKMGGQREVAKGVWVPAEGSGRFLPQMLNEKGRKMLEAAKAPAGSKGTETVSEAVQRMIAEGYAKDVKQARAIINAIEQRASTGGSHYLSSASEERLPIEYLDLRWDQWFPGFAGKTQFRLEMWETFGYSKGDLPTELRLWIEEVKRGRPGMGQEIDAFFSAQLGGSPYNTKASELFSQRVRAYQFYSKVGTNLFSAIPRNVLDRYAKGYTLGGFRIGTEALLKDLPFLNQITGIRAESRRIARETGTFHGEESSLMDAGLFHEVGMSDMFGLSKQAKWQQTLSAPFKYSEQNNRALIAWIMDKRLKQQLTLYNRYAKGTDRPLFGRTLDTVVNVLGDTPASVERQLLKRGFSRKTLDRVKKMSHEKLLEELGKPGFTEVELAEAIQRTTRDATFPLTMSVKRLWWETHPYRKIFAQFKTWPVEQVRFIENEVISEAKHGNMRPMMGFLVAHSMAGELYNVTRDVLTGSNRSVTMGLANAQEDQSKMEIAAVNGLRSAATGGIVGIFGELIYGIGSLITGPTVASGINAIITGIRAQEQSALKARGGEDIKFFGEQIGDLLALLTGEEREELGLPQAETTPEDDVEFARKTFTDAAVEDLFLAGQVAKSITLKELPLVRQIVDIGHRFSPRDMTPEYKDARDWAQQASDKFPTISSPSPTLVGIERFLLGDPGERSEPGRFNFIWQGVMDSTRNGDDENTREWIRVGLSTSQSSDIPRPEIDEDPLLSDREKKLKTDALDIAEWVKLFNTSVEGRSPHGPINRRNPLFETRPAEFIRTDMMYRARAADNLIKAGEKYFKTNAVLADEVVRTEVFQRMIGGLSGLDITPERQMMLVSNAKMLGLTHSSAKALWEESVIRNSIPKAEDFDIPEGLSNLKKFIKTERALGKSISFPGFHARALFDENWREGERNIKHFSQLENN